jgi:broad specificity phosphatase PhoE
MFCSDEVRKLGRQWYTHPFFDGTNYGEGIQKVQADVDAFLEHLGYRHDLENNVYEAVAPNEQRVALFAHEGVGAAVLSCILDIPYPIFTTHFDMTHTGVTVIEFAENYGVLTPRVLSYDNDSHIYREGLPTRFQNKFYF